MDEELERSRRLSKDAYEQNQEIKAHKEAGIMKEKIEMDREEREEKEREKRDSEADLIGTGVFLVSLSIFLRSLTLSLLACKRIALRG